jgi:CheY-like chemotaxis protein
MVGIIKGSGTTLERLLSDVLDLSRMETGAVAVVAEPFHLAGAVRAVAAITASRANDKGLEFHLDIDPTAETLVVGDAVRMKQVLTNLISNAVKFTARGHVAVSLFQEADGRWRIDVEDTGIGFDPADKDRLFQRFAQADGSVTRQFGGAGMGLTISRQLMDLMGGELDAVRAPGRGAIFTIRLPLATSTAKVEATRAQMTHNAPARALRVLLADDHPTNRRVVQVLLADFDIDLVCVENGREACEAFENQAFDLVLMDMQMPVMDGLTAIRTIRLFERERGLSKTAIVMLTANALPEHQAASLAAGADLHMPKPIEVGRLFAILHDIGQVQAIRVAA